MLNIIKHEHVSRSRRWRRLEYSALDTLIASQKLKKLMNYIIKSLTRLGEEED